MANWRVQEPFEKTCFLHLFREYYGNKLRCKIVLLHIITINGTLFWSFNSNPSPTDGQTDRRTDVLPSMVYICRCISREHLGTCYSILDSNLQHHGFCLQQFVSYLTFVTCISNSLSICTNQTKNAANRPFWTVSWWFRASLAVILRPLNSASDGSFATAIKLQGLPPTLLMGWFPVHFPADFSVNWASSKTPSLYGGPYSAHTKGRCAVRGRRGATGALSGQHAFLEGSQINPLLRIFSFIFCNGFSLHSLFTKHLLDSPRRRRFQQGCSKSKD